MFVDGFFNMLYGIAGIANSHVFVANAQYVIGDLRAWGWPRRGAAVIDQTGTVAELPPKTTGTDSATHNDSAPWQQAR
jgi:hypothetical protein